MENFNNHINKSFRINYKIERKVKKWCEFSLFLLLFFSFIFGYSQSKTLGSQKGETKKITLIVQSPDDPALHKYLDSLNLYKSYQAQLKFNPPQDVNRSPRRDTLIMVMNMLDNNAQIRGIYFKRDPIYHAGNGFAFYENEISFRNDCPMDALLIDFYRGLTFAEPTETGLWGTPELSHATIEPSSAYFGGVDINHAALNPVYKEPTNEIKYAGDPKDLEKYRFAPKVKMVQYYDVIDTVNIELGGGISHYKWYPKSGPLKQISDELYPDCTPYNTRTMIPHY